MTFIALNDAVVPAAEAVLPVVAEGVRYGSGCFETIAYAGGAPRLWDRHIARFTRSCQRMGFTPKVGAGRLRELLSELVLKNGNPQEGVVRLSAHQCGKMADTVLTFSPPRYSRALEALSLMPSALVHPGVWAFSGIKHNNYTQFLAAAEQAAALGFDEAALADAQGRLLEGSRTNLFAVDKTANGWQIRTAPLECGVLGGVMRSVVLELAPQLGVNVREAPFTADELSCAEGCFATNALIGVVSVLRFGDHFFDAEANVLIGTLRQAALAVQA